VIYFSGLATTANGATNDEDVGPVNYNALWDQHNSPVVAKSISSFAEIFVAVWSL
jgi:hypothetical protein